MIRLASQFSIKLADYAMLKFIRKNPGSRLFEINAATLKSHHSWGTKATLVRLESEGWLFVKRAQHGKRIAPKYYVLQQRGPRAAYLPLLHAPDMVD